VSDINPQEFGRLTAKVEGLEASVKKMSDQIDDLMAIVNQGRGAFWLAVLVGGAISSVVTWVASKLGVLGLMK
jgi:hypothetical protein